MKVIAALVVSGMLLMGQNEQSAIHRVSAVRHWSLRDVTRVAVEVSGPFQFRTERLHNPDRVYYDILRSHVHIDSRPFYVETVNDDLLQRIRVAQTSPDTTRVVLDLAGNVNATASTLGSPDRLIIELRMSPGNTLRTETPPVDFSNRAITPSGLSASPPSQVSKPLPAPPADASIRTVTPSGATASPADASTRATVPPAGTIPPAVSKPIAAPFSAPAKLEVPPRIDAAPPEFKPPVLSTAPVPKLADPPASAVPAPAPAKPEEIAMAAKPTSDGATSLVRALGLKLNRVVIDPGHGGHDEGTAGAKGLLEKDLVLDIALRVGKLVQDRMGAEVIYTRSDDTFVPLERRTALANEKKADLFLSIHANSSPVRAISGVETYYLNINGSKDAMDVAARENGATQSSIFDLQDIVKKIALHDKSEESHEFAKRIQASLYAFSLKDFPGTRDRGVKTAPFVVLIGANMPSVLAEIGFISNSKEEALLKRSDYREKLAEALYKGMEKYAESLSHFHTAELP